MDKDKKATQLGTGLASIIFVPIVVYKYIDEPYLLFPALFFMFLAVLIMNKIAGEQAP